MVDVSEIPVVGRVLASILMAGDWLVSGGEFILELITLVVTLLLGRPELIVGLLTSINRLTDRLGISAQLIDAAMTVALVAMVVVYVGKYIDYVTQET